MNREPSQRDVRTGPNEMSETPIRIPSNAHIGSVDLRVANLERAMSFYRDLLGFRELRRDGSTVWLSAFGGEPYHIALTERRNAKPKPARSTGLFHVAIRYPTSQALAIALSKLIEHKYPLQGAADHGVSEALYLADPDGIGIELYVDRPRTEWPMREGQLAMVTEPLDVRGLLDEADTSEWNGIDPRTDIGHVHLQISSLEKSEEFYCGALGFEITQSSYRGALFVSAGGYHHHIGMNVWSSLGAPAPPPDSVGLMSFSVVTDGDYLSYLASRLERLNYPFERKVDERKQASLHLSDPDGIVVDLTQ